MADLSNMRQNYDKNAALRAEDFDDNPYHGFKKWFDEANEHPSVGEANAFILSTANGDKRVRSRTVLLKYYDENGFVFFTNYGSQKAKDISENAQVAMLFPWYPLERQMIIEGLVEKVSHAESLKYFLTRPRGSQIGAWVSQQSQAISTRAVLQDKVKQLTDKFTGKDVPLPDFWGGYRIKPVRFEFWQGQPSRLHDRLQYLRETPDAAVWQKSLLSP